MAPTYAGDDLRVRVASVLDEEQAGQGADERVTKLEEQLGGNLNLEGRCQRARVGVRSEGDRDVDTGVDPRKRRDVDTDGRPRGEREVRAARSGDDGPRLQGDFDHRQREQRSAQEKLGVREGVVAGLVHDGVEEAAEVVCLGVRAYLIEAVADAGAELSHEREPDGGLEAGAEPHLGPSIDRALEVVRVWLDVVPLSEPDAHVRR